MSGFLCRDVASLTQSRWSIRVRQSPGVRLFASSQTLCTRNRALKEKEPATTNLRKTLIWLFDSLVIAKFTLLKIIKNCFCFQPPTPLSIFF